MQIVIPKPRTRPADKRIHPSTHWHTSTVLSGLRRIAFLITPALMLLVWYVVAENELVRAFLLPHPRTVAERFHSVLMDGSLWRHTRVTLEEVLIGLGIGACVGMILGYWIAKIPLLEVLVSPIVVLFQATPIIAYAPLLVIWFGSGVQSKVITCVLIVFFPILLTTVTGVRSVPQNLRDLMRVSNATGWQTFRKLEVPAAFPVLMAGLKTGATLAVIGAVVGEFIAANAGLGFLLNTARQRYDTPLVFVSAITLAVIAGALYFCVVLLERRVLAWQRR
jgi:NitT/TauT family transport system permease protein